MQIQNQNQNQNPFQVSVRVKNAVEPQKPVLIAVPVPVPVKVKVPNPVPAPVQVPVPVPVSVPVPVPVQNEEEEDEIVIDSDDDDDDDGDLLASLDTIKQKSAKNTANKVKISYKGQQNNSVSNNNTIQQPPPIPVRVSHYMQTLSDEDEQLVDEFMDRTRSEFQGQFHNFGILYDLGVPRGKNDFDFEYPNFRPRSPLQEAHPDEYVIQFLIHSGAFQLPRRRQ
ncbi:MAG: hypothetical protein EZS28_017215 [Streblomastix strix]|uniref:Uncharacterized protein n=1 Tax=Streblomastix strix TaxID=222440 RepID=A0A5J4VYC7_9EUKA|nr:MAG: hypothetical protein EZS28_017215 [Streblomastix strix]